MIIVRLFLLLAEKSSILKKDVRLMLISTKSSTTTIIIIIYIYIICTSIDIAFDRLVTSALVAFFEETTEPWFATNWLDNVDAGQNTEKLSLLALGKKNYISYSYR